MKFKFLLFTIGTVITVSSFAQKAKINDAAKALETAQKLLLLQKTTEAAEPLNQAKAAIDAAVSDPSTASNGKAWYTKAAIYMAMQEVPSLNNSNPYKDALTALSKSVELDKKNANEEQYPNLLSNGAFYTFNDGVNSMNNSKYEDAYNLFLQTNNLLGGDNYNKFFKDNKQIDSIISKAKLFEGYSAFYNDKYDVAVPLLKAAADNKITAGESNIYLLLSQAYEKLGKKDEQAAIIEAGKKKFPNDKNITAAELNYYISNGKQSEMVSKLEDAINQDPNNAVLPFNLGIVYRDMAKPGEAPTPEKEGYFKKAEENYLRAISLAPNNYSYLFELGALYYNKAGYYNNKMMNAGTDNASLKLIADDLQPNRDKYFGKASEYLEKARTQFKSNKSKLTPTDVDDYKNTLQALNAIYVNLDKNDKASEINTELKSL